MLYTSTRNKNVKVTSAEAIVHGISGDGGLFVPQEIPKIDTEFISQLVCLDYIGRAKKILPLFLTDFTKEEIAYCAEGAYKKGKFSSEKTAPLATYNERAEILELWRGPTCAFKDMALQLLPYLLTTSVKKTGEEKTVVILVATSGDTGKAALEGFKDVPGTRIIVFYPLDGVSPMQKLQMASQQGENVCVYAIKGNFDDAQRGVKSIFTDEDVKNKLQSNGMMFSSANSINWGRLAPQIVYYISAYCDMVEKGKISLGDKINIVVPTGNFGNILAAYYAKEMGLPVNKLICASNANNVLTDFLETGVYDKNRSFYTTSSPSMDILVSSNLERLLYHLTDDDEKVRGYMNDLSANGRYTVDGDTFAKIKELFAAGFCDDKATQDAIEKAYSMGYLSDTHTAVALKVYDEYTEKTGDKTPSVIASTANPYKFPAAVLGAVWDGDAQSLDEFDKVEKLTEVTGEPCPSGLSGLKGKKPRFTLTCEKDDMVQAVYSALDI